MSISELTPAQSGLETFRPADAGILLENHVATRDIETLHGYSRSEDSEVARYCQGIVSQIELHDDSPGLKLRLVEELVPQIPFDVIPDEIFVRTFAEGFYPIAHPRYAMTFLHDAKTHYPVYDGLTDDVETSLLISGCANKLNGLLEASGISLERVENHEVKSLYNTFVLIMDAFVDPKHHDAVKLLRRHLEAFSGGDLAKHYRAVVDKTPQLVE